MRKFLYIAALSIVSMLAFQSGAVAQYEDLGADDVQYDEDAVQTSGLDGSCAGAIEQLAADQPNVSEEVFQSYYSYLPDVGGRVSFEGNTFISSLSVPVYDSETGEDLGIVKDLDSDLTSGDFSVTHEEFCGGFIPAYEAVAQEYFDQKANDKEQAILDPDGDGRACTDEDDAFLSVEVVEPFVEGLQCIDGILDRDGDGKISSVEAAQACADVTQGYDPCSGIDDETGGTDYDGAGSQFEQIWSGRIIQTWDDGGMLESEVEAEIIPISEMTEDVIGEAIGEVRYIGFCTHTWILQEVNEDSILVEGRLKEATSNCFEFVPITLTPQEDGSLEYYYSDSEYTGGSIGEGILTFRGGGDYEPEFLLEDTWTGVVTQTNPDGGILEFEIEVAMTPLFYITDSMIGDVVAEISHPTIGCSGVWILDGFNGDEIIIEERITTGREKCRDTPITLTPRDDGSLDYYFLGSTGNVGECVLSLQNTPEDKPLLPSEILRQIGINELPDTGGVPLLPVGALLLSIGISVR